MAPRIRSLCVFCGSQAGSKPVFAETARAVGQWLGRQGIRLVYGGGSVGLMGAVADGCLEEGGEVFGVITTFLKDKELGHKGIARLEEVETMLDRKRRMAQLSDAFVSLPGGIGTMDELFEMLTWSRLFEHDKPSGLLNVDGFYDELISFLLKTQVENGFIRAEDAANLLVSDDFPDLIEQLENALDRGPSTPYRTT